jgi:hypothetical protein
MAKQKRIEETGIDSDDEDLGADEDSLKDVIVTYIRDACDYKWKKSVRPELEESYNDSMELKVDGFRVSCPICGSHEVQLDEG